jgi:hypothetical protein
MTWEGCDVVTYQSVGIKFKVAVCGFSKEIYLNIRGFGYLKQLKRVMVL